ncbi:MAG: ABC transporter ATP-binding protein [bacterium]|nr:ABC transporter ATP-binding protein [bacterium]
MAAISLEDVRVVRDGKVILDIEHLDVSDGELVVALGPSGAGKSTLLRAIAGLDPVEGGKIRFGGVDMSDVATENRGVAMVFQDQALYPFMNVRNNVAFPLKVRKTPIEEVRTRVEAEARVLEIAHLLERKPDALGAGHQQLVQAARALVRVPDVFLMDEPLARLDAHLRVQMRQEFRLLQQGYGVTTIFVTNDQQEAMVMADRIVVLRDGAVRQIGAPLDLYGSPANRFVAGFIGSMGFVPARLSSGGAGFWVTMGDFRLRAWTPNLSTASDEHVDVGVRPEDVVLDPMGVAVAVGKGYFMGSYGFAEVELAPGHMVEMRTEAVPPPLGSVVNVRLRRLHLFDPRSGLVLGRIEDSAG